MDAVPQLAGDDDDDSILAGTNSLLLGWLAWLNHINNVVAVIDVMV